MTSDQVSEVIFKPCTESNFNNMGKSFIEHLSIENQELKAMVIENNRKLQILQDERNEEEKRQLQISEDKRNNENNQQLQISEGKRNNENKNWFTPLKIYNRTPFGSASEACNLAAPMGLLRRPTRDSRATLPINELKGNPPSADCPISNLHRCKNCFQGGFQGSCTV